MSASPAQTYRLTILVTSAVAFGLLVLFGGIASYELWRKRNLPNTHEAVLAKVESVGTACNVERKSGKTWRSEAVLSCEEAAKLVAERNSVLSPWRSVEGTYALLAYTAQGAPQQSLMYAGRVSEKPLAAGEQIAMYADKSNPQQVELPFRDADTANFWFMLGMGVIVAIGSVGLGWLIAAMNLKHQNKVLTSQAARPSHRPQVDGIAVASNGGDAQITPLWSKVVRWFGHTIVVVGLLFAAIAALGSSNNQPATLRGAFIIAIISVGIWRLCAYTAKLGVTAVRK